MLSKLSSSVVNLGTFYSNIPFFIVDKNRRDTNFMLTVYTIPISSNFRKKDHKMKIVGDRITIRKSKFHYNSFPKSVWDREILHVTGKTEQVTEREMY